ncbi:MAG: hypothetical protein AAGG55_06905 [Pseudomonadota bacterium]
MAESKPRKKRGEIGRWHITSRVFAALIPAFLLTNTFGVFLVLLLPGDRLGAIAFSTLVSFIIYCCVIMWIFSVERLRTVWLGLLAGLIITGGGAWGLYVLENFV